MRRLQEEDKVKQGMDEEEPCKQTPDGEGGGYTASPQLTSQLNSSKGGDPLPSKTLASMNHAFGADFFRTDTLGPSGGNESRDTGEAFTHGSDIYFNHGQYNPTSSEGKTLLAHN
ncbi:MAG: DUF4157 domain-containing protein [Lewinellaceae bacterium]|nr:DUF4157 domain-containing protein [Lewinellaceae bacterium]